MKKLQLCHILSITITRCHCNNSQTSSLTSPLLSDYSSNSETSRYPRPTRDLSSAQRGAVNTIVVVVDHGGARIPATEERRSQICFLSPLCVSISEGGGPWRCSDTGDGGEKIVDLFSLSFACFNLCL